MCTRPTAVRTNRENVYLWIASRRHRGSSRTPSSPTCARPYGCARDEYERIVSGKRSSKFPHSYLMKCAQSPTAVRATNTMIGVPHKRSNIFPHFCLPSPSHQHVCQTALCHTQLVELNISLCTHMNQACNAPEERLSLLDRRLIWRRGRALLFRQGSCRRRAFRITVEPYRLLTP